MTKFLGALGGFFKRTDYIFWFLTIAASLYGFALIYSVARSADSEKGFLATQILAVALGYICAIIISLMDYNVVCRFWYIFAILGVLALVYTYFFGIEIVGTDDKAWIRIAGRTFQTSELVKIFFIITFSKHLAVLKERNKLKTFVGVMTLCFHALVPIGLIHLMGDDGTALVFGFMFLIILVLINTLKLIVRKKAIKFPRIPLSLQDITAALSIMKLMEKHILQKVNLQKSQ